MQPFVVPTRFTAIDGMSPVVGKMSRNLHSMVDRANIGIARQERLFRKLTPGLGSATKQLLGYASAGSIFAGAAYSGKAIMDYETAIQSLSSVTGVKGKELESFKSEITDLASRSKKSATDVAGSFEVIGSAMSEYLNDPKALRQISEAGITLSKASRQELVPTLENLTSIMNQFNLKADQANDTINRLTAGEIVGSLRTNQVAEALQEMGASAYSSNVTLAESIALLESLGKQMKVDKIGVGARNILTVLDSAKGLDKKARMDLRKSGVDLNFLMDKTKTLSERLRELSKISGNSTVITSVFGKENKTAAQVIFNQLGTYDQYLAKIKTTNEAQSQAITNSNTFRQSVDRLVNTWKNYLTTSDKTALGLEKIKTGIGFVTDHLDELVSIGVNVIKFYALWKGAIIAAKIVTTSLSIVTGIQNALQLQSIAAIEGNIIATKASIITEKALAASIAISTGNITAFNAALGITPFGWAIAAAAALAGGIWFLSKRQEEYNEQMERQLNMKVAEHLGKQSQETERLANHWKNVGYNIKDATIKALQFQVANASRGLREAESKKMRAEQNAVSAYDNALFPAFSSDVSRANQELKEAKDNLLIANADKLSATNAVISAAKMLGLSTKETRDLAAGNAFSVSEPKVQGPKLPAGQLPKPVDSPEVQEMNKRYAAQQTQGDDFMSLRSAIVNSIQAGFDKVKQTSTVDINVSGISGNSNKIKSAASY